MTKTERSIIVSDLQRADQLLKLLYVHQFVDQNYITYLVEAMQKVENALRKVEKSKSQDQ